MNYALVYPRFWLWYFAASVAVTVVGSTYSIGKAFGSTSTPGIFGAVLEWAALWPLYGYVRQRRINPLWLWRAVLAISSVGAIAVEVLVLFVAWRQATLLPVGYGLLLLALAGPHLLALHQYAYRSPHIWRTA